MHSFLPRVHLPIRASIQAVLSLHPSILSFVPSFISFLSFHSIPFFTSFMSFHSFLPSFIHSFMRPSIHSFLHPSIHSFISTAFRFLSVSFHSSHLADDSLIVITNHRTSSGKMPLPCSTSALHTLRMAVAAAET